MQDQSKPRLILVLGPTASGKTELAASMAERYGAEVINCDSMQVYKSLDVGTAKPDIATLQKARHHLLSIVEPGEQYTAGQFRTEARAKIFERFAEGQKIFVVVGGSGFYARALLTKMFPSVETKKEVHDQVEKESREIGIAALYQELKTKDPLHAQKLSENDHYRILRSIEIIRSTGRLVSELVKERDDQNEITPEFNVIKVGLKCERLLLKTRIHKRTLKMLELGFVNEVKGLLGKGLADWRPLSGVGYKEIREHLEGKLDASELADKITQSSLQLAKKQMTWFKKDKDISWFDSGGSAELPMNYVDSWLV